MLISRISYFLLSLLPTFPGFSSQSVQSSLKAKEKKCTSVTHALYILQIVIPFLLHFPPIFAEFIKKIEVFSLQLSVICSNSLAVPVFLDLLSESLWLGASLPEKDLCTHKHDGVSVFPSSAVLHKFHFHVFQSLFMFFSQLNGLPLAQGRAPS